MRVYPRGKGGILWVDLTIDGQRVKRSSGTTDPKAAQEYAATLARDLWRQKRLGDAPTVTWDAAVLAWLKEHGHRRSIEDITRSTCGGRAGRYASEVTQRAYMVWVDQQREIAAAVAAEREACAQVCEDQSCDQTEYRCATIERAAAAIRARADQQKEPT